MIMENNFAYLAGQAAKDKSSIMLLDSLNKKICFPYSSRHYLQLPNKHFPRIIYVVDVYLQCTSEIDIYAPFI